VEHYLPLDHQTVFAYDTVEENTGERGLIVLQITRPRAGSVEIHDGGNTTRLELAPDGVRYVTGGYWLKTPFALGACWQGRSGKVCVSRLDQAMRVPAGNFTGCLETLEQTASLSRVKTVFCPHVGMVSLDAENDQGGEYQRVIARLKSYGPRVDIANLPGTLAEPPASSPAPERGQP
jgi:hypothetical protein